MIAREEEQGGGQWWDSYHITREASGGTAISKIRRPEEEKTILKRRPV